MMEWAEPITDCRSRNMISRGTVVVVLVFVALFAAVLLASRGLKHPATPEPTPARTCDETTHYGDLCVSPAQS